MAISYSNGTDVSSIGSKYMSIKSVALDNSYLTGGYLLDPKQFGLTTITQVFAVANEGGYYFEYLTATGKLGAFVAPGGGGGNTGDTIAVNAPSAVTGTGVGTATGPSLISEISGVGNTAAGQVITTTDNQTCALNQFRGKWLIQATGATPPNLILSNTAAAAAPVAFTVQGVANTDAGSYDVLTLPNTAVTVSALTATAAAQVQTTHHHTVGAAGGGAFTEVSNGTDLSAVTNLQLIAIGQ